MQYGFLSLVPPLLTILLALLTKNVFISLFIGIMAGSLVMTGFFDPLIMSESGFFSAVSAFFRQIVEKPENPVIAFSSGLNAIVDCMSGSNVIIIASCLIVGAVIHLMERSGGIEGFVNVVVKSKGVIRTKRGANLFTWLLGLAVFTSGSLSCMVTGAVSRPVNDALKVPHEKSAFLVHTTSTPWCVLFPFSGWLASMAGYLASGGVPEGESVAMLFKSLPFNFYCILAILMALFVSVAQKDFGPMAAAEKRADQQGLLDAPGHGSEENVQTTLSNVKPRACNLLVPVGVLIVTIFTALIATGWAAAETNVQIPVIREIARAGVAITKGSGMQSLLWAVVLSLLTILIMTVCQKVFTLDQAISEMFKGMGHMLPIAFILLFGFTMGNVVKGLDTGSYLSYLFQKLLSPALLPALTFLIAMLISFATGTSMGTMAIMAVISLPMAYEMGVSIPLVAGAMYGGSIFGDHCSPISDTTIMTCSTTGCDIIDHVKTQAPYCVGIAVVSFVMYVIFGFIL